jgi:hypothetical protein
LLLMAPFAIAGMIVFIAAGGAAVRLLWNWLMPPIFGWPAITLWQAIGLLALCRILFGGFGRPGCGPRGRMRERMEQMTPEERERFRQGMRARWGFGSSAGESGGGPSPT